MKLRLVYILALLLGLPVYTLSYVKTVLHVAHHEHEHDEDPDHSHDHSDRKTHADGPDTGQDFGQRGSPDQPAHSHDRDVWGLFSHPGLSQDSLIVDTAEAAVAFNLAFLDFDTLAAEPFSGSLFRPPIA